MSKPAFPRPFSEPHANVEDDYFAITPSQDGMSLLEYYIGKTLPSVVTTALNSDSQLGLPVKEFNYNIANIAINIAEAVVAEVEKRSNS